MVLKLCVVVDPHHYHDSIESNLNATDWVEGSEWHWNVGDKRVSSSKYLIMKGVQIRCGLEYRTL